MKQEVTVEQVAAFLQVNRKSAIQRMSRLVKKNKAVKLNWPTKGTPAKFLIDMPLEELLLTQKFAKYKAHPDIDWRKFCSDPFNLGAGAR